MSEFRETNHPEIREMNETRFENRSEFVNRLIEICRDDPNFKTIVDMSIRERIYKRDYESCAQEFRDFPYDFEAAVEDIQLYHEALTQIDDEKKEIFTNNPEMLEKYQMMQDLFSMCDYDYTPELGSMWQEVLSERYESTEDVNQESGVKYTGITINDAAELFGVDYKTIYRMVSVESWPWKDKENNIDITRDGRQYILPVPDVLLPHELDTEQKPKYSYISIYDAAELLNVDYKTIYRMLRRGEWLWDDEENRIGVIRMGRDYRLPIPEPDTIGAVKRNSEGMYSCENEYTYLSVEELSFVVGDELSSRMLLYYLGRNELEKLSERFGIDIESIKVGRDYRLKVPTGIIDEETMQNIGKRREIK